MFLKKYTKNKTSEKREKIEEGFLGICEEFFT